MKILWKIQKTRIHKSKIYFTNIYVIDLNISGWVVIVKMSYFANLSFAIPHLYLKNT